MSEPLDINELASEIDESPKVFALRFAELVADVREVKDEVTKGKWLAFTVLVGVVVDLSLRLLDQSGHTPAQLAEAVSAVFT